MTREPPHFDDLPFIRPAVADYRRRRLRGYDPHSAQEMALLLYMELRPDEDAHEARRKVMDAIRWAKQEVFRLDGRQELSGNLVQPHATECETAGQLLG